MKKLTFLQCDAKAAVYEACADFLGTKWTSDPAARQAGRQVAQTLRARALKWRKVATRRVKEGRAATEAAAPVKQAAL